MNHVIALAAGALLDFLIGDPRWLYHPVCLIGKWISLAEKGIRKIMPKSKKGELAGGFLEVLIVALLSFGLPFLILRIAYHYCKWIGLALEIFWCGQLLAGKSLKTESMKVYNALKNEELEKGRQEVGMIVGRDTRELTEEGVVKAAVETVAENTSDGYVAPAFYMMLGGASLMFLYKGINTMDSMLGYKNERYLYFGRIAAKLDDVVNYIPARLSGWIMIAAAWLTGFDAGNAWKIYRRDRHNHTSPNAAQTESVMAGALRVQLAGNMFYFGKLYKKKTIGDDIRPVEVEDIARANRLAAGTDVLCVAVFVLLRLVVYLIAHV